VLEAFMAPVRTSEELKLAGRRYRKIVPNSAGCQARKAMRFPVMEKE
jgi:hypothetical protein